MYTKEELFEKQRERDRERLDKFKALLAQLNSPKQQRLFGQMGLRVRIKVEPEEPLPSDGTQEC